MSDTTQYKTEFDIIDLDHGGTDRNLRAVQAALTRIHNERKSFDGVEVVMRRWQLVETRTMTGQQTRDLIESQKDALQLSELRRKQREMAAEMLKLEAKLAAAGVSADESDPGFTPETDSTPPAEPESAKGTDPDEL